MKKYVRVMLGPKSIYAQQCYNGNFIGADFDIKEDLTNKLHENWKDFNAEYRPVWLEANPGKSKVAAGLACGMLWTICKGIRKGDIVLCPDGQGNYYVGEVDSDYYYKPNEILFHRRNVKWYPVVIERNAMSQELKNSSGSIGTTSDISQYAEEIERLIGGHKLPIPQLKTHPCSHLKSTWKTSWFRTGNRQNLVNTMRFLKKMVKL
jgi:restriction system protein